jgi:isoaspartyl peptidase/L-asparaginase-like protein (Ntn-hydrolase superfamily)
MVSSFGILIHSGASKLRIDKSSKKARDISKSLRLSVSGGYEYLKGKKAAIDAVEAAVTSLEDSGIFNAGIAFSTDNKKELET